MFIDRAHCQIYVENETLSEFDVDQDGLPDAKFEIRVFKGPQVKDVSQVFSLNGDGNLLGYGVSRMTLTKDTLLATNSTVRSFPDKSYPIYIYSWYWRLVSGYTLEGARGEAKAATSTYLGFVLNYSDGKHFGWVKFSRPNTDTGTIFTIESWDWNPTPDEEIQVGHPPPPPKVFTTFDIEARTLTASWTPRLSTLGWHLEGTASLVEPVVWHRIEGAASPPATIPLSSGSMFLRLVKE